MKKIMILMVLLVGVLFLSSCSQVETTYDIVGSSCDDVGGTCYGSEEDLFRDGNLFASVYSCEGEEEMCFIEDNRPETSLTTSYAVLMDLIYMGVVDVPSADFDIEEEADSWVFVDANSIFKIDKDTSIINCFGIAGEEISCNEMYATVYKNNIILDTEEFSCIPLGEGSECSSEVIAEYYDLKLMIAK